MRLVTVGTGTAAPHAERVAAGYWVEAGPVRLLMDCGPGIPFRLAALGLPWGTVTHVALTHFHFDHVGDVPGLIAALRWGQMPPRDGPLPIIGPVGTAAWLARVTAAHGDWVTAPDYAVVVHELASGDSLALAPGVTIAAHAVPHTVESVAYSVASRKARLVYTGDTGYDESLARWAAGCDVLVTECSLPAALAIPEHLTPESAGALAARVAPGRLVLSHFYPPVERVDIAAIVGAQWSGPVVLARDGTVIEIEDD